MVPAKGGMVSGSTLPARKKTLSTLPAQYRALILSSWNPMGIALDEAQRNGANLSVTELVDRFYAEVQKAGGARWDTSSLITRLT